MSSSERQKKTAAAPPPPPMSDAEREIERKRKLNAAKLAGIKIQLKSGARSKGPPPPRRQDVKCAPSGSESPRPPAKKARECENSDEKLIEKVAPIFKQSDSESGSDHDEMPAECRMRMRNIGRDTPTSSGPNSFGKTKQGFVNPRHERDVFDKGLGE